MRDTADLNGDKYKNEGTVSSQCNLKYDRLSLHREATGHFFSKGWGRKVHSVTPN